MVTVPCKEYRILDCHISSAYDRYISSFKESSVTGSTVRNTHPRKLLFAGNSELGMIGTCSKDNAYMYGIRIE